jgi:hypothetical protein
MKSESSDLANLAGRHELLSDREKVALASGIASARIGMGGFVKQRYDRQVSKLIASKGAWGRKMLARKCVLVRTDTDEVDEEKSSTLLSLFVFDDQTIASSRKAFAKANGIDDDDLSDWNETLCHVDGNVVCSVQIKGQLFGNVKFSDLYKKVADSVFLEAKTTCVNEYCKFAMDPLSYSNFIELIQEQSSLPAILYNIAEQQGPAVLFDAKVFFPCGREVLDDDVFNRSCCELTLVAGPT